MFIPSPPESSSPNGVEGGWGSFWRVVFWMYLDSTPQKLLEPDSYFFRENRGVMSQFPKYKLELSHRGHLMHRFGRRLPNKTGIQVSCSLNIQLPK